MFRKDVVDVVTQLPQLDSKVTNFLAECVKRAVKIVSGIITWRCGRCGARLAATPGHATAPRGGRRVMAYHRDARGAQEVLHVAQDEVGGGPVWFGEPLDDVGARRRSHEPLASLAGGGCHWSPGRRRPNGGSVAA